MTNNTKTQAIVVTYYNSYDENGNQVLPVMESISFDTEEEAVDYLTELVEIEVNQMRRYRIGNQSRFRVWLEGTTYDEEGYRTNLCAQLMTIIKDETVTPFDFDYTIMPDENNMIPSFNTESKIVGFFNINIFTPEQAVNATWEHIKQLPYARSVIQPYTYMVRKQHIKKNPLVNNQPEGAYLYTTANDPRAITVWEVPFVIEQED